jgi:hypothetical protein
MGDPISTFIITALGVTEGSFLAGAIVAAVDFAIVAGVSYGANALFGPDVESPDRGRDVVSRQANDPQRIILGKARVFGTLVGETAYHSASTTHPANTLVRVQVLAGHEIDGIDSLIVGGETVSWNSVTGDSFAGGSDGAVTTAPYRRPYRPEPIGGDPIDIDSFLTVSHGLGKDDQPADAMMRALAPSYWRSTDRLRGLAYLAWHARLNPSMFNGEPQVAAVVRGLKVHDPRDPDSDPIDPDTWTWTENNILLAAHYDRFEYGPLQDLVLNLPGRVREEKWTDWDMIADGADKCAELRQVTEFYSEKRYRCWGTALSNEDPERVISRIMGACGGWRARPSGVFRAWPGAYYPPVQGFAVGEGDILDGFGAQNRRSVSESAGGVSGEYYSEEDNWKKIPYPAVKREGLTGEPRYLDLPLDYSPSPYQCQQIAQIELRRRAARWRVSGPIKLKGLLFSAGDTVSITYSREGIENMPVLVEDWAQSTDEEGVPIIEIMGVELREADFSDPPYIEPTLRPLPVDIRPNRTPPGFNGGITGGAIYDEISE